MPELPDVELYRRHLDAACLSRTIRQVAVGDARIRRTTECVPLSPAAITLPTSM
jgi:formamidopyrimidine-DNA glycosylase